jgi:hypothetical protein
MGRGAVEIVEGDGLDKVYLIIGGEINISHLIFFSSLLFFKKLGSYHVSSNRNFSFLLKEKLKIFTLIELFPERRCESRNTVEGHYPVRISHALLWVHIFTFPA